MKTEIEINGINCFIETISDGLYKGYIDSNKYNGDEELEGIFFYKDDVWSFDTSLDPSVVWRLSDTIKELELAISYLNEDW
jgi:hypothetical protein